MFNFSQIQTIAKGEKIIRLWKVTLKDATDDISLTLFGSMVDVIEEISRSLFTVLQVSKYKFTRHLKTKESTKITPAGDKYGKF